MLSNKKVLQGAAGTLISVALIVWIAMSVEWAGVARELGHIRYWAFLPSLLVIFLHFLLRAWRWRYLLPPSANPPSIRDLYDGIMLGNFATYILPLRAGEFVRPVVLAAQSNYSFSSAFVSVVIERFFDLSCVLFSFAVVIFYIEGIPGWVSQGAMVLSGLAVAILAFILIGSLIPEAVLKVCGRLFGIFPPKLRDFALRFLSDFLAGAAVLKEKKNLLMVLVLSAAVWLSTYLLFYVYFLLFDMEPGVWLAVTTAVIVALAVAAPSAPGFIGVYQTACIAGFVLFGRTKELAVAYSVITHLFQYVVFGLYTLQFFVGSKHSFSSLMKGPRKQ